MYYLKQKDLSNALCDMYDIRNRAKALGFYDKPKDDEGSEITIGDCIHDVIMLLEEEVEDVL